jgi:penicillin-binding protein 1A
VADENDPNKPEDDLPETRPTGETEATPVEQPRDEAPFTAEQEPPIEPEPPAEAAAVEAAPPEPEPESTPAIEAVTPPFEPPAPIYTADAIDEPFLEQAQEIEPASEAVAPSPLEPPAPIYAADTIISEPVEPAPLPEPGVVIEAITPPPAEPPAPVYAAETIIEPEPDPEPPPAIEAPVEPTPASPAGALPPNYFRAAGDPDEPAPEDETPPTLLQKLKSKAEHYWASFRAFAEPRYVKYSGAARAFAGEMWNRLRGIKRPKSVREAAVWGGWIAAGGVAFIIAFFLFITWGLPSTDDLWEARQGQSITFVDINGHVILREGAQNAPPVDLETLPPYVAQAFIAIEDRKFYDHLGVDFGGIMRAGAENIRAGRVVQGGSTITQQLAKNLFLTNERSWRRKAQEIMLAFWLESRFSKDEILALYLSRVYFGAGAYGIEAAAERYFDRPARELTLLQSAMIAGLVKAPSRLNPARQDIAAARERATVVLNEMVALGFISASERDAALQEELVISRRNPAGVLSYYRDWIDPILNEVIGNERDDFIIETTIDIAAQRAAAEAVELVLAEQGEDRRVSQAAALAIDDTGGVRVIVGGRDYDQSQFNRATQARRQPGSSFKYFIYLAAMENGLTPWSVREDAPITISIPGQPDWTPGNYTNEFHGSVTLTSAYANSFNMVAIRVANEIGGDKVIDVARRLGVTSPLSNYHSLALGAQEMTMLEMVSAYGAMAADGNRVEAHGVTRIRRASSNETMWSFRPQHRGRVIEERPFRYMNQMMSRVVEAGTGTRARMTGRQIGGKTGTGNDYRDAWFIGYTPGMVGGVWVGNDNFTTTARVTGGSLPADIWARFMPVALRNTPARPLEMPTDEDYDLGVPAPVEEGVEVVGAPVGAVLGGPVEAPPDTEDRSLDFGPEG